MSSLNNLYKIQITGCKLFNIALICRLSDGKLLSDIQDLQSKVGEQQTIIDSQNEMLDEAQLLLQQLKVVLHFVIKVRMKGMN